VSLRTLKAQTAVFGSIGCCFLFLLDR
jgi:hypothetical protein